MRRIEGFQWDLGALMDPDTYRDEALRGRKELGEGHGVGRFGVSCPKCMHPLAPAGKSQFSDGSRACTCPDRPQYDTDDCLIALGLTQYRSKVNMGEHRPI